MPNVYTRTLMRFTTLPLALAATLVALPANADVESANMQPEVVNGRVIGLESGQAKGVYCDLVDTGFNSVTLDIPLLQPDKSVPKIVARPAGSGTSPTPTDSHLRTAIRNARKCGVRNVILKPHLELSGGEWRAHIKGSKAQQAAWDAWLLRYVKIAKAEHASTLVIGVEQKGMTLPKGSTDRWKHTVGLLRKAAPKVKLTYAAHTGDELLLLGPSFVRKLDYISVTWYKRPQKARSTSVADLEADMRTDKREFDRAWKRYGKRLVFAEVGFRSISMGAYFNKRDQVTASDVDLGLQARQYEAMFRFTKSLKYVDGWMLYRAENTSDAGGKNDAWFSWQGKPSEQVIARYFGGKVPRR